MGTQTGVIKVLVSQGWSRPGDSVKASQGGMS